MLKDSYSFGLSLLILFYAFSPFRIEKGFVFQIQAEVLIVIMVLAWIGYTAIFIKQIYTSNILKRVAGIDLLLLAHFSYLLLQMVFYTVDTEYRLTIVCVSAAYLLFRRIPVQLINILLILLPILAVVQIIYGYNRFEYPWQTLSDNTGAFNNTGIFGGFVAMGFVSALGLLLSFKQPVIRITLGVLLITVTIQLIYSYSRAAWLAAAIGTVILLIPTFRKLTKGKAAVVISVFLIASILFSIKLYHLKKDSADGRLLIWTVSWNMIKEKPLIGYGPGGFRKNYLLRQGVYFKNRPDSSWSDLAGDSGYPFNEFLKTEIEQGSAGLFLLIGILFFAFSNTASPLVFRAVLAALVGFSFFSYPFDIVTFQILSIFCLAGIASTQKPVVITGSARISLKSPAIVGLTHNPLKYLVIFLIIAFCGTVLFASCNYFVSVKKWNQALRSYPIGNEKLLTEFQDIYPAFKHNGEFAFVYGEALYKTGHYEESIPLLEAAKELFPHTQALLMLGEAYEKAGEHSKALNEWEIASYIRPSLFKPHYNIAKLCFKLHDYEQARQQARELLDKKIKIDNPEIDQMKSEAQEMLDSIINYKL